LEAGPDSSRAETLPDSLSPCDGKPFSCSYILDKEDSAPVQAMLSPGTYLSELEDEPLGKSI
jgi:hypothetical protein